MKKIFTIAVVFLGTIATTNAQKIGVVSPDEVFSVMPETRKADSSLQQFQKALADNYGEMEAELNAALEKFVKDSSKMDKATKEVKRNNLQTKIADLQKQQESIQQTLEAQKEKELRPIREKMKKAIEDVAKENGYTFVMYKEGLIVFPETEDITEKVKAKLKIKK